MPGLFRHPPQPQQLQPSVVPLLPPPAAFDPSTGFPWNQDAGESFVQSQCWPDPTTDLLYAFGPPLNAVQTRARFPSDDVDAVVQSYPVVDDSIQAWAVGPPQNAVADQSWNQDEGERFVASQIFPDTTELVAGYVPPTVQAWAVDGGEVQSRTDEDPSVQSWAVGPTQNAVQAQAFNQPDEAPYAPVADDSIQSWAVQVPSVAAFDPAAGFPWNTPDEAPYAPTPDDTAPALTLGNPPELTTPFNAPEDEATAPLEDPTVPAWAVGPPQNAVAAQAFYPADNDVVQAVPAVDDSVQAWHLGPPQNAVAAQSFNIPDEASAAPVEDPSIQSWAVNPPVNAVIAQAFNQPDEAPYGPTLDESVQSYPIQPPLYVAVSQLTAFAVEGGEQQAQPGEDPSIQAWSVGSPQNAILAQPVNGDSEVTQALPVADDTAQAWSVGSPQNVDRLSAWNDNREVVQQADTPDDSVQAWPVQTGAFSPAAGFPYNQDDSERFAQQQLTDDNVGYALGLVPLNAVFNTPDEAPYAPTADDTAQTYSIQPAFDPASVPWSQDDVVVQPVWTIADDTNQSYAIQPPFTFPFNTPQDVPVPAWMLVEDTTQAWTAPLGLLTVVTGGYGPGGSASSATVSAFAYGPTPGGSAVGPVPGGSASNPTPER